MNMNTTLTAMAAAILVSALALAANQLRNHHSHQTDEQPNDVAVIAPQPLPEPEPERSNLSETEAKLIEGAKILLASHFKDHSVGFANMRAVVERQIVCGVISLQNRSGGDFTVHRFIAKPSEAMFMRETKAFSPAFSPFWDKDCTTKKQSINHTNNELLL